MHTHSGSTSSQGSCYSLFRPAISFVGGSGAIGSAPPSIHVAVGGTYTLPANTFTRPGYEFRGWSSDGGTTVLAPGTAYTVPNTTTDMTYTAEWKQTLVSVVVARYLAGNSTFCPGQTVTAAVAPSTATASYLWKRGGTPISGATGMTYIIKNEDAGQSLTVTATGTGNFTGIVTSAPVIPKYDITAYLSTTATNVTYGGTLSIASKSSNAAHPVTSGNFTYTFSGTSTDGTQVLTQSATKPTQCGTWTVHTAYSDATQMGTAANTTFQILPKNITLDKGTLAGYNKTYDTTTATTYTGSPGIVGRCYSDSVTVTGGTLVFADANAGTSVEIAGSGFALGGADATNYTLTDDTVSGFTGEITPANGALNPNLDDAYDALLAFMKHIITNVTPTLGDVALPPHWDWGQDQTAAILADNSHPRQTFVVTYLSSNPNYQNIDKPITLPVSHIEVSFAGGLSARILTAVDEEKEIAASKVQVTGAELTEEGSTLQDLLSWVYLNSEAIAYEEQNDLSNAQLPLYKTKVTAVKGGSCMVGFEVRRTVIAAVVVRVKISGEFSSNTAEDIAKQTDWLLTLLADEGNMSAGDKEAVKALGAEVSSMTSEQKQALTVDTLRNLDRVYALAAGLLQENAVIPLADVAPAQQFPTSGIQIIGTSLAAGEVENMAVAVNIEQIAPIMGQGRSQLELRMTFFVDGVKKALQAPLVMVLPLPSGVNAEGMTIGHYSENGTLLEILVVGDVLKKGVYVLDKAAHTVTLRVDSFSSFGFLRAPTPPSGGGSSSGTGGSVTEPRPPKSDANESGINSAEIKDTNALGKMVYRPESHWTNEKGVVPYTMQDGVKILAPISAVQDGFVYFLPPIKGTYYLQYNPAEFWDVGDAHWAWEDIEKMAARKVLHGVADGEFAPELRMGRGMFVTALYRLASGDGSGYSESHFYDVAAGKYYLPSIEWAFQGGLAEGIGQGLFAPEADMSREEMAKLVYGFLQRVREILAGKDGRSTAKDDRLDSPRPDDVSTFSDAANISPWAKNAVEKLQQMGILEGREDGRFDPKATATRAELSTVLGRLVREILFG